MSLTDRYSCDTRKRRPPERPYKARCERGLYKHMRGAVNTANAACRLLQQIFSIRKQFDCVSNTAKGG